MAVLIELRVAELICSRLCHELINPIGAINNGVELLTELEGRADPDTFALIGQSARTAAQRLQFYRLAYGFAAGLASELSLAEAGALADGAVATNRIALDWPKAGPEGERRPGRQAIKLLLNLFVLAAEALPRGGRLALTLRSKAGGLELELMAAGEGAKLSEETRAAFQGALGLDALSARNVHGYFTARLAEALELPVRLDEGDGRVGFRVALARAA